MQAKQFQVSLTVVKHCKGCKPQAYQDGKYGRRHRVMNATQKSGAPWRCTVCGLAQS